MSESKMFESSPGTGGNGTISAIVVADMLFASRVRGVAGAMGTAVRVVGKPAAVAAAVRESGVRLVLVDLELPAGRGLEAIRAVRDDPETAHAEIVGFSSHRNTNALREGRAAGADRVLARSAFIEALPSLLSGTG